MNKTQLLQVTIKGGVPTTWGLLESIYTIFQPTNQMLSTCTDKPLPYNPPLQVDH